MLSTRRWRYGQWTANWYTGWRASWVRSLACATYRGTRPSGWPAAIVTLTYMTPSLATTWVSPPVYTACCSQWTRRAHTRDTHHTAVHKLIRKPSEILVFLGESQSLTCINNGMIHYCVFAIFVCWTQFLKYFTCMKRDYEYSCTIICKCWTKYCITHLKIIFRAFTILHVCFTIIRYSSCAPVLRPRSNPAQCACL